MTIRFREAAVAAVGLCLLAAASSAQPSDQGATAPAATAALPSGYLQVGPILSRHGEGEQYHRASPPLVGTTSGAAIGVGARVDQHIAIEAELAFERTLSATQADVYFSRTDYTAESRDVLLSAHVRFRPNRGTRLEFTAGGGMVYSRFARRDVVGTSYFPPRVSRGADSETSAWQPMVAGSAAFAMPLSRHVDIVPAVGARWIERGSDTDAWYFGLGRITVFMGAALRMRP